MSMSRLCIVEVILEAQVMGFGQIKCKNRKERLKQDRKLTATAWW
jgi:hypothetical protein